MPLILASKSPRRAQLLTEAGIPFQVRTADVEEVYPDDLPAEEVAPYLARLKAHGSRHLLRADDEILLTADSVVILDGHIYHKPTDREDAIRTLRQLSGRVHVVVTGCCLHNARHDVVFAARNEVHFDHLTLPEIEYYLDRWQPYDKAGAYGIQEWLGHTKITKIDGTYPGVMGLPVHLVYRHLTKLGFATHG